MKEEIDRANEVLKDIEDYLEETDKTSLLGQMSGALLALDNAILVRKQKDTEDVESDNLVKEKLSELVKLAEAWLDEKQKTDQKVEKNCTHEKKFNGKFNGMYRKDKKRRIRLKKKELDYKKFAEEMVEDESLIDGQNELFQKMYKSISDDEKDFSFLFNSFKHIEKQLANTYLHSLQNHRKTMILNRLLQLSYDILDKNISEIVNDKIMESFKLKKLHDDELEELGSKPDWMNAGISLNDEHFETYSPSKTTNNKAGKEYTDELELAYNGLEATYDKYCKVEEDNKKRYEMLEELKNIKPQKTFDDIQKAYNNVVKKYK